MSMPLQANKNHYHYYPNINLTAIVAAAAPTKSTSAVTASVHTQDQTGAVMRELKWIGKLGGGGEACESPVRAQAVMHELKWIGKLGGGCEALTADEPGVRRLDR